MTVERSFPLNPAQMRNLRNWAEGERADRTIAVAVVPPLPASPGTARAAVTELVRRHQALRSRLVEDADGAPVQQVVTASAADVALVETEARPAYTPERVDPAERALHATLYLSGSRVVLVQLSLSHLFIDAFGAHAVVRELRWLLAGEPLPAVPRQAGEVGADAAAVRRDTERWKGLLDSAPRSVTYSGVARDEHEKVGLARVAVEDDARLAEAGRRLRVTPYVLWATAISALVSRTTGQHRQVFRSTYANRFAAEDFRVVDQLAQAVYVPIDGDAKDSLRTRAERIAAVSLRTYRRGHYDANELLRWLNEPARSRGAFFQPAFELNYVPAAPAEARGDAPPAPGGCELVDVRIDPRSAKADLAVAVSHLPDPVLRLFARRPVSGQREPDALAADCLAVLGVLCTNPDTPVTELPVEPFPATAGLHAGHRSGALVDLDMTRRLVLSVPGVESCELLPHGDRLTARITTTDPVRDLPRVLRDRQPWWSGSVVPDDIAVTTRRRQLSAAPRPPRSAG